MDAEDFPPRGTSRPAGPFVQQSPARTTTASLPRLVQSARTAFIGPALVGASCEGGLPKETVANGKHDQLLIDRTPFPGNAKEEGKNAGILKYV